MIGWIKVVELDIRNGIFREVELWFNWNFRFVYFLKGILLLLVEVSIKLLDIKLLIGCILEFGYWVWRNWLDIMEICVLVFYKVCIGILFK